MEKALKITGKRIYLRELTIADASNEYCNWLNDSEVNKYLETRSCTIEDLKEFIKSQNQNPNSFFVGIFDKNNDKHIGNIKIDAVNWHWKRGIIGILIGEKDYWGKGIATESTRLMIHYAFKVLGLDELELGVIPENKAAIRLYKKLGFKVIDKEKEDFIGPYNDHDIIMVLKKDNFRGENMRICKKCVQPDTRPNVYFNEEGVCGACLYQEEAASKIDWDQRHKELMEIAEWARKTAKEKGSNYDCVIGVSGGKDSTFQAMYARDVMKLRPLLVNCEPEGITEIGAKNRENLKNLGFDMITLRPNPVVMKKLIKRDFYKYANPVKVTEFALWASAYIIADKFDIPLIVQGENDCLTLGVRNKQGLGDDAMLITEQDTLASGWQEYVGEEGTAKEDLFMYYFNPDNLRKKGIRAIWLQYYTKDWSPSNNAVFSRKHGFTYRGVDGHEFNPEYIGTYVPFFQLDSDIVQVNQMIKHVKFGFGQCVDHACYDIRDGVISREEGVELVNKYDGKCAYKYIKKFCDYICITVEEFWHHVNKFRGPMWKKNKHGEWVLQEKIT